MYGERLSRVIAFAPAWTTTVGTLSASSVSRTASRTFERSGPKMTSAPLSSTSLWACWIPIAGLAASSPSTNWILRPPRR
jgi:hypothetical protein